MILKKIGYKFYLEHFEGNELKYKIFADNIRYIEEDTTYSLTTYVKRVFGKWILKRRKRKESYEFSF